MCHVTEQQGWTEIQSVQTVGLSKGCPVAPSYLMFVELGSQSMNSSNYFKCFLNFVT